MFKRKIKKVICTSLLILSTFMFISEALAASSTKYRFTGDGSTIAVYSDSKLKGNVGLKATRDTSTQYYNGTFRFILYKKGLFGNYSEVNREMKSTYKDCGPTVIWGNKPNANYKGTLQLYAADTTGQYSGITTTFSIFQN